MILRRISGTKKMDGMTSHLNLGVTESRISELHFLWFIQRGVLVKYSIGFQVPYQLLILSMIGLKVI